MGKSIDLISKLIWVTRLLRPEARSFCHGGDDSSSMPCPDCARTHPEFMLSSALADVRAEVAELREENAELRLELSDIRGVGGRQ